MLDDNRARPQRGRRIAEEADQHAVLKTLDVDLQRIDLGDAGLVENAYQPQRWDFDGISAGRASDDVSSTEIAAAALDHQLAVAVAGGGLYQAHLRRFRCGLIEGEPSKRHRMRLDRDHLALGPDLSRHHQRKRADIGADVDEHAARLRMLAQEIELVATVVRVEQRAALGRAALVIEAERGALILHVDGTAA